MAMVASGLGWGQCGVDQGQGPDHGSGRGAGDRTGRRALAQGWARCLRRDQWQADMEAGYGQADLI